jgi:hypothetical protein
MSGIENAIEGIIDAYEEGIAWTPVAEKEPDGTVVLISYGLGYYDQIPSLNFGKLPNLPGHN